MHYFKHLKFRSGQSFNYFVSFAILFLLSSNKIHEDFCLVSIHKLHMCIEYVY